MDSAKGVILFIGGIAAAIISYAMNGSVGWAILAFILDWIYVLYAAFARTKEIVPALKKFFM